MTKSDVQAIRCEALSRRYGDVEALRSLDLSVRTGSVFGFLGRNGAGKTTTIRLLTGLARPTSGRAWVANVEITDGTGNAREKFGYLPEEPAFYTWMTPREFLEYVGLLFGLEAAARRHRADELLAWAGLQDAADRRIGGFSRGMRQRLGLAQALMHQPPVLFLDEPTSALDPAGRRSVLDLIDGLREITTVFLSSHILADVEQVCDTIGVIHEGELLLVAGRSELLAQYPANQVVLELDTFDRSVSDAFLKEVRDQRWISEVTQEGDVIRLTVGDVAQGKQRILRMVVDHGLPLARYEWVRPSLEEVFLEISR